MSHQSNADALNDGRPSLDANHGRPRLGSISNGRFTRFGRWRSIAYEPCQELGDGPA